jgi:hypothetical protein
MDTLDYYRQQISRALHELVEWGEKRKEAEQQMTKLRQLIVANANFLPEDERGIFVRQAEESVPSGFTDNIRHLFRVHFPKALTPVMLRQELLDAGIDLSAQSNPLASIHSVIRRLLDADEIERYGKLENGAYRWKEEHPLRAISRKPKSSDQVLAALNATREEAARKK